VKERFTEIKNAIIKRKAELIQWTTPTISYFVIVVVTLIFSLNFSNRSVGTLVEKQFEGAASYYADSFYSAMLCLKEAAGPIVKHAQKDYKGDLTQLLPYLEALKTTAAISEVWVIGRDGEGFDSSGAAVSSAQQDYLDAVVDDDKRVVFMTYGPEEEEVIAYLYPFEDREFTFVSFYDPEQFLVDTSVFKLDVRTWYASINGDGEIMTLKAGNSRMSRTDNVIKHLSEAKIKNFDQKKMLDKMDKKETFLFLADTEYGQRYIVMAPAKINDWYFVLGIPIANYRMLQSRALGPIKLLTVLLPAMMIAFLGVVIRIIMKNDKVVGDQNEQLKVKADTDLLTGLNNKVATEYKIKEYIAQDGRQGMLFVIDIDNFKKINDTMGHAFGDEVLRSIGESLRVAFRSTDVVGRFGGDEFIVFLKNISTEELIQKEADKVYSIFNGYVVGTYTKYKVTASIGCSVFPRDAEDFEGLFKAADAGLYVAKRGGKNQLSFYNTDEKKEND
jgi:diguanylate cyclase (GGDEF)-like protein